MYSVEDLKDIMKKLRDPDTGCPWDKEQTHKSLTPYVVEEAYEVVDAIEAADDILLVDELGDLLLQVFLHAQIAHERGAFGFDEVVDVVSQKMVRRHPHIFGDTKADTVQKVWQNWEKIKSKEKADADSIMDTVPKSLPALVKAEKVQKKAARLGFDWDKAEDVLSKVEEEVKEVKAAKTSQEEEEEFGDLFFALVNLTRKKGFHAEELLRKASDKFVKRFKFVEQQVKLSGKHFEDYSLTQLDEFWNEAKRQ